MAPLHPLDLSAQQMRTFCAVCELGGYSEAARQAGMSTSAAWEHVKEVERQYGTQLFLRRGRQVHPTRVGVRLRELFQSLLAGLDSSRAVIEEESGRRPRQITVAAGVRMLMEETGLALRLFQQRYPEIVIRVLQSDPLSVEASVVRGEADLAMMLEPGPGHVGTAVILEPAYDIDYLVLAPYGHALSRTRSPKLAEIVRYPLIVPPPGAYPRVLVEQTLYQHGLWRQAKIAVETANSAFTAACVRAGLGVGIIGGRADGPLCRGLVVRSLTRWMGRTRIVFVWKRGAVPTPTVAELAAIIREAPWQRQPPRT